MINYCFVARIRADCLRPVDFDEVDLLGVCFLTSFFFTAFGDFLGAFLRPVLLARVAVDFFFVDCLVDFFVDFFVGVFVAVVSSSSSNDRAFS